MPRPRADWQPYHQAATGLEGVMSARVRRGMALVRNRVSISDLAGRLQHAQQMFLLKGKRLDRAEVDRITASVLTLVDLQAALAPVGAASKAAVMKGGQICAAQIERHRKAA